MQLTANRVVTDDDHPPGMKFNPGEGSGVHPSPSVFDTMPWLAPEGILRHALLCTLPAGASLVRTGERVEQVFILVEGAVVEVTGGRTVDVDRPGTLLGGALSAREHTSLTTVRARTPVAVLAVPRSAIDSDVPEIAGWLSDQRRDPGIGPIQPDGVGRETCG